MKKIFVVSLLSLVAFGLYAKEEKNEFVSLQENINSASERYSTTLERFDRNNSNVEAFYKFEEYERRFTLLNQRMHEMDYQLKTEFLRRNTSEIHKIHREFTRANQLLTALKAEYDEWISSLQ